MRDALTLACCYAMLLLSPFFADSSRCYSMPCQTLISSPDLSFSAHAIFARRLPAILFLLPLFTLFIRLFPSDAAHSSCFHAS